jgi:PhnB protein
MSIIPNYVPSGFHLLNVLLMVKDGAKALEWYNRAFGAEETMRLTSPEGKIVHAEMKIADTTFMLAESEDADHANSSIILQLYTPDVETFVDEAVSAGAEMISPIAEQFYGARAGRIKDPFGVQWIIATHMENITAKQLQQRFYELYS